VSDTTPDSASARDAGTEPTRAQLAAFRLHLVDCVRLEAQLAAASRAPQLRRGGVRALGALAIGLGLITAFVLINLAILLAVALALPAWTAALVLAAAWIVVALVTAVVVTRHGMPLSGVMGRRPSESADELRAARNLAWHTLQHDLERMAPSVTDRAIDLATPIAAELATRVAIAAADDVVEDVVDDAEDIGRELVEESEEVVEVLAKEVPGANIANTVWDLALRPGRTGVRMVTTVLKRPPSND
jgi:hypothetical protein